MTTEPKTWKSHQEQLEILKARGMAVPDEARALDFLKRVGYYRLSGYFFPFRQGAEDDEGNFFRKDEFIEGSNFDKVIDLYLFDRKLRLLALDAIERIELALQADLAYRLGEREAFAHETADCLHPNFTTRPQRNGKTGHENWLDDYERLVLRARRRPFVAHNLARYGCLPIWVAIEIWDFGTLSKLFGGLRVQDKIAIEARFGLNEGRHLQTWLRGLNFIRNTAAHHSRLWNCNVVERANVPNQKLKLRDLDNSRPFLYFCVMKQMLDVICPESSWGDRFKALLATFPDVENRAATPEHMGVVDGWEEWGMWA